MAITFVGAATGVTSASMPPHEVGDLIVVFAFRDGNTAVPSAPASFFIIHGNGTNTCSSRTGYKVATSTAETVGTWTNATSLIVMVFRGVDQADPIGASNLGGGSSTTIRHFGLAMEVTDGSSAIVSCAGHRSANVSITNLPNGMTLAASVSDATDEAAAFYLLGAASFTTRDVSVGGTASGWRSSTIELRAAAEPGGPANGDYDVTDGEDETTSTVAVLASAAVEVVDSEDLGTAAAGENPPPIYAEIAVTDQRDTSSSTSLIAIRANSSVADQNDSTSANGWVRISGAVSSANVVDTTSSTGAVRVSVASSIADAQDATASASAPRVSASVAVIDGGDQTSSLAKISVAATLAVADAEDATVSSTEVVSVVRMGIVAVNDGNDVAGSDASTPVGAAVAVVDNPDQTVAMSRIRIGAQHAVDDAGDSSGALARVRSSGAASYQDDEDSAGSSAELVIGIYAAIIDGQDAGGAAASALIVSSISAADTADHGQAIGGVLVVGGYEWADDADGALLAVSAPSVGVVNFADEPDIGESESRSDIKARSQIVDGNDVGEAYGTAFFIPIFAGIYADDEEDQGQGYASAILAASVEVLDSLDGTVSIATGLKRRKIKIRALFPSAIQLDARVPERERLAITLAAPLQLTARVGPTPKLTLTMPPPASLRAVVGDG